MTPTKEEVWETLKELGIFSEYIANEKYRECERCGMYEEYTYTDGMYKVAKEVWIRDNQDDKQK